MFSKKVKPVVGPSFPFIENKDGKISMSYDTIKFNQEDGFITLTYMQEGIPIYAFTYEALGNYTVEFSGMKGKVEIKFNP